MKKNKDYIPYTVTKNDRYANLVGSSLDAEQAYIRYGSHRSDNPAIMGTMLHSEQQEAKKRSGGYGSYKILDQIEKL